MTAHITYSITNDRPSTTKLPQHTTVSLVSRDPSFCCDDCMVEINTPLESAWSTKLISVGTVVNRGMFDELEQVIVCAARSVHRFL